MAKKRLSNGLCHDLPSDLEKAILSDPKTTAAWESISAIARNEWICWTINVKQDKTRQGHVARAASDLAAGKKRPCCWVGCIHRSDKPVGAWAQKALLEKRPRTG